MWDIQNPYVRTSKGPVVCPVANWKSESGRTFEGVGLNSKLSISRCLSYADDFGMFAANRPQMTNALKALHSYCSENRLTVNSEKTVVVWCYKPKNARQPFVVEDRIYQRYRKKNTHIGIGCCRPGL